MEETIDVSKVTRVELIDHSDHSQVAFGPARIIALGVSVQLSLQDEGRTLKIFLGDSPVSAHEVREAMVAGLADFIGTNLAEDLPQAPGLMTEDLPQALRHKP